MSKNLIIITIILVVLLGVGYYFFNKYRTPSLTPELPQPPTPSTFQSSIPISTEVPSTPTTPTSPTSEVIIKITANGFEPKEVEVTKGTKVTWVNESVNPSWPASAVHPTHRVYPGSGIEKCGTLEEKNIFDACRALQPGESWSFVFNEIGEWSYHDHLNPSLTGKIVVK